MRLLGWVDPPRQTPDETSISGRFIAAWSATSRYLEVQDPDMEIPAPNTLAAAAGNPAVRPARTIAMV